MFEHRDMFDYLLSGVVLPVHVLVCTRQPHGSKLLVLDAQFIWSSHDIVEVVVATHCILCGRGGGLISL